MSGAIASESAGAAEGGGTPAPGAGGRAPEGGLTREAQAKTAAAANPKMANRSRLPRIARNLASFSWRTFSMQATMVLDRALALEWYRRNRARSDALFALIPDFAYADRPIALRNPICFYEGPIPA